MAIRPNDWKQNPKNVYHPIEIVPEDHTLLHPFTQE